MKTPLEFLSSLFKEPVPHNSFPTTNNGVLDGQRPEDYIAGTLPFEVRNATGDWRAFLPSTDEIQYDPQTHADAMACVSFSLTNSLEVQAKKLTAQSFNWSDRFLAKMSGTTQSGNYLYKVADTVRQYGLVNEATWPAPQGFTWNSYYSDIPQDVIAKGKAEFPFSIAYEWIPTDIKSLAYHLQHAPIQVVIPSTNPVHAVCLVYADVTNNLLYYYDSYPPFIKTMSMAPNAALKIVLYDSRIVMRQIGWNDSEKGVYVGFDTPDRKAKFLASMQTLFPDYRIEDKEWNLGKRPWG